MIKNADIGILVGDGIAKYPGGGLVYIDRARILSCNIGIKFQPFNHYNKSSINIFSTFSNTQDIVIKSNYGFNFENVTFNNSQEVNSYGIILHNSSIDNLFSPLISSRHIGITVLGSHPSLNGFDIGDRAPSTGAQTFLSNCDVGIALSSFGFGSVDNMNIKDTKFRNTELGIMTIGECEYNVFDNQFEYLDDSTSIFMLGLSSGNATNDCYCNNILSTSMKPGSIGFGFAGNNKNTTIFGNTFDFSTKSDDCIRTEGNGDIFITQSTFFDPTANPVSNNLPAGNDFKDINNDLLIDFSGNEIRYIIPNDNTLFDFFPKFVSNYSELQSVDDPLSCLTIIGKVHEPDTLIVGDDMPTIVKDQWPDPIIGPEDQEEYIKYINDLPTGTIDSSDLISETAKAEYALYNSVISESTSGNFETLLGQLEGNIWKRILYGYYIEKDEIQSAENVLQTISLNQTEDYDFVFIQEIVIDKLLHEINEVPSPFTISNIEKQTIETIIDKESIVSGYASALYFDIYGEVLLPTYSGSSGSIPRRAIEKNNPTFNVYPNPSNDLLYLEGLDKDEEIEILDLYLNKLVKFEFMSEESIDISNLKSGIYFIRSSTHGTIKFIKN